MFRESVLPLSGYIISPARDQMAAFHVGAMFQQQQVINTLYSTLKKEQLPFQVNAAASSGI
jgi:hypothetical protein